MNFLNRVLTWVKKIFIKKEDIKMLESPSEEVANENRKTFLESLKIKVAKKKVETLICDGDGLGIQKTLRKLEIRKYKWLFETKM
ncbi:MAG: hypothetical protein LBL91_00880 [Lachnospiraceae bacterium]|nr:hypothetical protein [Lachnospiraceae bacterium]